VKLSEKRARITKTLLELPYPNMVEMETDVIRKDDESFVIYRPAYTETSFVLALTSTRTWNQEGEMESEWSSKNVTNIHCQQATITRINITVPGPRRQVLT
jgi:hypothetical protein